MTKGGGLTVEVKIAGMVNSFHRVDKKNFLIGEYYRLPNGSIYFYHSFYPKIEFMLVPEDVIPKDTNIYDLEGSG